ncbi:Rieske (2Fe-2S) protein [Flavobacterium sp.]|uniref:Rieske (2Fe-2S) protein n=1 Tax=Flavobacterium sp. TaxID=239 RepID=UPI003C5B4FD3
MKKIFFLPFISVLLMSCSSNSNSNQNPYIPNYPVSLTINLDLPQYNDLKFPSNAIYQLGQGAKGIFVINTGSGYNAFDAACPNQALSDCSTMGFKKLDPSDVLKVDKTTVVCPCDQAEYNLFSGQSAGKKYPLKQYRVEVNQNVLRIYN